MIADEKTGRIAKLANALKEEGADAFIAWDPISMRYLHGFAEHGHERFMAMCISPSGEMQLICPALSETQAKRAGIQNIRSWRDGEDPVPLFKELAESWNLRSGIIYVDSELPAHLLLTMQEALPAALFKSGGEMMASLMRKKDLRELDLMKKAADIADQALIPAVNRITEGMTELQLDQVIREEMQKRGGKPVFCIIAAGPNSAEPHHESDNTPIQSGDIVLFDYGCSIEGYNSDTTRVVCFGRATEEMKKVYSAVMASQAAGRTAIKPGVTPQDIDRAARKAITDAGYGEFFIHRTGHGIGLKGHEDPYIVEGNATPLELGECFSIEPGIYLPGKFGVRIENIVTLTPQGHFSFNEEPEEELREIIPG